MQATTPKIKIPRAFRELFQPARYKVYYGGRGGGRSWAVARAMLLMGAQQQMRFLCAREFQRSIEDSVYRLLVDQIRILGLEWAYEIQQKTILGVNGTSFLFEGLRHNVTKIKSLEGIDVCWVEEAEKVSAESWDVLIPTIRKESSEIWITFNPDQETDPTYERFVKSPPPESIVRHTTWRDNPFFPEPLRKEKDYLWRVDPERAAHIWEGECRSHTDAQVLKHKWRVDAFEQTRKETDGVPWNGPYFGADWGFAQDPTVLVRFWISPEQKRLYIENEAYGVGVDINDTPALFDQVPEARQYMIRADSARPETINHMRRAGFRIEGAPKWSGSVEDGVAWLRSFEEIIIHDRCRHAIDEARNWQYKVDRLTGDVLPQLEKGSDHIWDAVRYGAAPLIRKKRVRVV